MRSIFEDIQYVTSHSYYLHQPSSTKTKKEKTTAHRCRAVRDNLTDFYVMLEAWLLDFVKH